MAETALKQTDTNTWTLAPSGAMRVPAIVYASRELIDAMDDKVLEQARNVATLPGIVRASFAMPDAHWGYGFPIGGVAAFDPDQGGVISAGGVGFDISCGVRTLHTGLSAETLHDSAPALAQELFQAIPAGVGSRGRIHLQVRDMKKMLAGGAQWAVGEGYGTEHDLERIEEHGCMPGAEPERVSDHAIKRQQDEMGTLGSGNHYLEVQKVTAIYDEPAARVFALKRGDILVSIHCGSRGLGHQIGTEFLKRMAIEAPRFGIALPDRELACAPLNSPLGREYLGVMRAAINCALANRQILTALTRRAFSSIIPGCELTLLYDVSHNTCKVERHHVDGDVRELYIHRKGATRAFPPGHPDIPPDLRDAGQPVLIGGSMGTASYILAGMSGNEQRSFSSACHGAGRAMSRHAAKRRWQGRQLVDELQQRGIIIKSPSLRGVAEEAPLAYKDVSAVVDASETAGLARKVAKLEPLICIKG